MFGYTRRDHGDRLTGILLELSLPTLNTVVHNSRALFILCRVTKVFSNFLAIGVC